MNQRRAVKDTARNVRALQLVCDLRILSCLIMRRFGVEQHRVDLVFRAEKRNDLLWLAGHNYQRAIPGTPLLIERTQRFKSKLSTKARNGWFTRQFVAVGCAGIDVDRQNLRAFTNGVVQRFMICDPQVVSVPEHDALRHDSGVSAL